jgi:hypothetical protein
MATEDKKHWMEPPEWWKKAKPLRWLAILGILFVAVSVLWTAKVVISPSKHPETAKFTDVVADPVAMITPLKSYDSVAKVREVLDGQKPAQRHAGAPRGQQQYLLRDTDTIVVSAYRTSASTAS